MNNIQTNGISEEYNKITIAANKAREQGQKIIVVQGLGFVGAVNSAVIATSGENGKFPYFVIGVDLPTPAAMARIDSINNGISPFASTDIEVGKAFEKAVLKNKNLMATSCQDAYSEGDIVLVDINLDVIKHEVGNSKNFDVAIEPFKKAIRSLGEKIKPTCLVLIETTVPPGTVEHIVEPILKDCFEKRGIDTNQNPPLLAHSYERVMPGKDYVKSIRQMWRAYSGVNPTAKQHAKEYLENITDTKNFPLTCLGSPAASELAKVMENNYRAVNIALIHEWTILAENMGVNLYEVIKAIKVRKGTHDNMMFPGFGVGGYCLTKDSLLAQWSAQNIFAGASNLVFAMQGVNVNDLMPIHTCELLEGGLNNNLKGKKITILGASYRRDVDDTRNSPTMLAYNWLTEKQAKVAIHDPLAHEFIDAPHVPIEGDMKAALKGADGVILAVDHAQYIETDPVALLQGINSGATIIDANNILTDEKISLLKKNGFHVLGVGKGHIGNL